MRKDAMIQEEVRGEWTERRTRLRGSPFVVSGSFSCEVERKSRA